MSRPIQHCVSRLVVTLTVTVVAGLVGPAGPATAEVCRGMTHNLGIDVQPPEPPQTYTVPPGALVVSTTEELYEELQWSAFRNANPIDIMLEDGIYPPGALPDGFLELHGSHRLWSETPGGAVLQFGIHIGHNFNTNLGNGVELHGLRFDIHDEAHGARANPEHTSAAVMTWGLASHVLIEDCFFDGNGVVDRGIDARQANGLVVRRVEIENFKRFGVFTDRAPAEPLTDRALLTDLQISGIGDNDWARSFPLGDPHYDPAYPNYDANDPYVPAQEIAIWVGLPTYLARARIRDISRVGVNAADEAQWCVMQDLDVDEIGWREQDVDPNWSTGAGLYFEDTTQDSVYRRFCIGPDTDKGVTSEWDHHIAPRGLRNLVEDGLIESSWIGINFDQGTVDSYVRNIYFRNAWWAGLMLHNNVWPNDHLETIHSRYEDIYDVGLPPGSCLVTAYHPENTIPCSDPPPNPQNP